MIDTCHLHVQDYMYLPHAAFGPHPPLLTLAVAVSSFFLNAIVTLRFISYGRSDVSTHVMMHRFQFRETF